jgi:hypothetical protein
MINLDSNFNEVYEELSAIGSRENLHEANKIVNRFANSPWYSGSFRGLNDISTATAPEELERRAKEEEERKLQQECKEFERAAKKAIAENRVAFYNYNHRYEISHKDHCPAVDLDTNEFVYDSDRKEEILKASEIIVDEVRKRAAMKGLQTKAANQAAAAELNAKAHLWTAYYTINGDNLTISNRVLGNDDPDNACLEVKKKAIKAIKAEMHECQMFNEPFQWDGKLIITTTPPQGKEEVYKKYKFNITKA